MQPQMNLEAGAGRNVDESRVPDNLTPLIPLVRKWGFKSMDDQDVFVRRMKKSRPGEVREFARAVDAASEDIRAWGLSLPFGRKHLSEYTEDDRSHPFHAFISMIKCREAVGWKDQPLTPEELGAIERQRRDTRLSFYQQATQTADDAFRRKDYVEYIRLLSPFGDLLTPTQKAKFSIAKSKAQE